MANLSDVRWASAMGKRFIYQAIERVCFNWVMQLRNAFRQLSDWPLMGAPSHGNVLIAIALDLASHMFLFTVRCPPFPLHSSIHSVKFQNLWSCACYHEVHEKLTTWTCFLGWRVLWCGFSLTTKWWKRKWIRSGHTTKRDLSVAQPVCASKISRKKRCV